MSNDKQVYYPDIGGDKHKVRRETPVSPQSRTVTRETPTSSPGVSPTKSYTANTPVAGGTRVVPPNKINTRRD